MKHSFFKLVLALTLLVVGADVARAQFSLGVNGIEFLGAAASVAITQPTSVHTSALVMVRTKPKTQFGIGRSAITTIPSVEVGWNVLSNVSYGAPYAEAGVGDFLDINNWKSMQVTVNLFHLSAYSHSHKVGATIGLGVRANNYRFASDLSLSRAGGVVMPYNPSEMATRSVKKSKFNIASVHIPVEVMFGRPNKFAFSVGGYVDMVMNSHTKIKYQGGRKEKEHNYPVNFIQAGVTARLTFSWFSIFATYQPTQIFKDNRGPRAQQWTIGIGF